MTPDEIIDAFSSRTFPSETIAACRVDKDATSLILRNLLEDFLAGDFDNGSDKSRRATESIFLSVHMLAEFQEKRAYPLLMRLLREDSDVLDEILGGAITETLPGILISLFDGNLDELHQLITNPSADEYVRSSAMTSLAYMTTKGTISRESTKQFLQKCFDKFRAEKEAGFAWVGWVDSIATLGMESFVPLVEQAFREQFINPMDMELPDFYDDLQNTLNPKVQHNPYGFSQALFDSVDELSSWAIYEPERDLSPPPRLINIGNKSIPPHPIQTNIEQHLNPYRDIGRNDPCPCGSGKKFKKCCLQ